MASEPSQSSRRKATRRIFLRICGSALGLGIVAPLDARYVEPYALDITRHDVRLPNWPASHDGLTVAHLTDLHCGHITPDAVIAGAVRATLALKPDLIALTGDFVEWDPADAARLVEMLAPLSPPLGIWACLGNHDYAQGGNVVAETLTTLSGGRIQILRNASAEVAPGIWTAAIEDTYRGKPDGSLALRDVPTNAPLLFLTHNPVGVFHVTSRPSLALSGHTHGGQICIPGMPLMLPPGMDGFPLGVGWGMFDQARLYISRGVGMGMAPLRFRCRPEVALHTIRRGDGLPRILPNLSGRALQKAERIAHHVLHRPA